MQAVVMQQTITASAQTVFLRVLTQLCARHGPLLSQLHSVLSSTLPLLSLLPVRYLEPALKPMIIHVAGRSPPLLGTLPTLLSQTTKQATVGV
jgi:hypothetical protein